MEWSTSEDAAVGLELGLESSFHFAADGNAIIRTVRVGGRRIELHFACEALLACFAPALARLETDAWDAPADLTIRVWDGDSARVRLPRPPWSPENIGPRGEIRGFDSRRFRAAFNLHSGTLSFADSVTRRSYFWTQSAARLPAYERATPFRTLFAWGVQAWGSEFAHAGCVAHGERGVLLVGKGGSGKSTCALSCLGSGFEYVADDYCVLSLASDRPEAYGFYATGKLDPAHLRTRFPGLSGERVSLEPGEDKATLYVDRDSLRKSADPVSLEALVLPKVAGNGTTTLARCTVASALTALAPSSIFQIPGLGVNTFRLHANVARRLPCYTLTLGDDLSVVRQALSTLIP